MQLRIDRAREYYCDKVATSPDIVLSDIDNKEVGLVERAIALEQASKFLKSPKLLETCVNYLYHDSPFMRFGAVKAIKNFTGEVVRDALLDVIENEEVDEIRKFAVETIDYRLDTTLTESQ